MNTGPMTRSECDVLLYMLDRLSAQEIGQVDRYAIGRLRGLGLYFLTTAQEEQHSRRVERGDLRLVADAEDRSVRGRTL